MKNMNIKEVSMKKQKLIDTAVQMAKRNGLVNVTCAGICKVAKLPLGSFNAITGMTFPEFVDHIGELCPESKANHFRLKKGYATKEDRKEDLLKASMELSKRIGYSGVRHSALADEAGVHRTLVYHYFATKDQLLRAMMHYAVANNVAEVVAQGIINRDEQALMAPADVKQAALEFFGRITE